MWTLDSALELIRSVEPEVKDKCQCFLGLCGSVLRKGQSGKDLDVIVIPMNGHTAPNEAGVIDVIATKLGVQFKLLNSAVYNGQLYIPLDFYGAVLADGRRLEVIFKK